MNIAVITLFPEMFTALTDYGVSGRALARGIFKFKCFNPRAYTEDRHQTVDDRPYGGGPGMVMMVEPLRRALAAAQQWITSAENSVESLTEGLDDVPEAGQERSGTQPPARAKAKVIYLSPQGRPIEQNLIADAAEQRPDMVLIAGRYEGIDERFIEQFVDEEWSLGDYVLSGGELPAMVVVDALARLLPGALGDELSAEQDSFAQGLLDCPHYTRPFDYNGTSVPQVLLSGNHEQIERWRLQQSLVRTLERRPDLLEQMQLSEEQQKLLDEYRRGGMLRDDKV